MWQPGWRDKAWADLDRDWDLIVVGGGITGAGIFSGAARAGLRVLLLEARDFASGTSSRSSKLVHGGLRYLRNGQIKTTFLSVKERKQLLNRGRGLVLPLEFLFVIYEEDHVPLKMFEVGLGFYNLLGLRWDHRQYGAADTLKLEPKLKKSGLESAFRYMDAKTDDARLVLRVIQEGVEAGGLAINYAKVEDLLRTRKYQVRGAALHDLAPGGHDRTREIEAKVVINATGTAADRLRRQVGGKPSLRILKGSHLIFSHHKLPLARAVSFAHPVDRRPVFALPWEGVTVYGTTDVDFPSGDRQEPALDGKEHDYLMVGIRKAFPSLELESGDVQASFSGVRAVLDTGRARPSKEPRDHAIWDENGLLTVAGGKLTTYRIIAQDALKAVWKRISTDKPFPGIDHLSPVASYTLARELPPAIRVRLIGRYGLTADGVFENAAENELLPVAPEIHPSPLWAELRWAVRHEAVIHLDDLLLRRVRIGLILPEGGIEQMDSIRSIVQPELGWDDERWASELKNYLRLWRSTYSPTFGNSS